MSNRNKKIAKAKLAKNSSVVNITLSEIGENSFNARIEGNFENRDYNCTMESVSIDNKTAVIEKALIMAIVLEDDSQWESSSDAEGSFKSEWVKR